jgi:perosamine synthetase
MTAPETFIPVAGPSITEREGELAREAALTAWGPDHYRFNARFESMLASYVGVPFAASLPHATSGLHLALAAAGIGAGDEVIGPDVTWIASMAPVSYVGASPVFVDILPDTWCIDPASVEAAITPCTKAIVGVNLYGSMCDWPRLREIAARHGLLLIEDAAESIGSTFHGQPAGSLGDVAVFSFHGSKTITTGEGGMIVTANPDLFARIQKLRDHGRPPKDRLFQNDEVAFKYKMSAVQAALGIAQMERIDSLIAQKRKIFSWYQERLSAIEGLYINAEPLGVRNSYWMVTAIPPADRGLDKFALQREMLKKGIDTRPFFSRLSTLPAYANLPSAARFLPEATNGSHAAGYGINLPSGYHVTEEIAARVSDAVTVILR